MIATPRSTVRLRALGRVGCVVDFSFCRSDFRAFSTGMIGFSSGTGRFYSNRGEMCPSDRSSERYTLNEGIFGICVRIGRPVLSFNWSKYVERVGLDVDALRIGAVRGVGSVSSGTRSTDGLDMECCSGAVDSGCVVV